MIVTTHAGVDILADDDGSVSWMSDWARCDELARGGFLVSTFHGPSTYGHVSFHIADVEDAEYPVGSVERCALVARMAAAGIIVR